MAVGDIIVATTQLSMGLKTGNPMLIVQGTTTLAGFLLNLGTEDELQAQELYRLFRSEVNRNNLATKQQPKLRGVTRELEIHFEVKKPREETNPAELKQLYDRLKEALSNSKEVRDIVSSYLIGREIDPIGLPLFIATVNVELVLLDELKTYDIATPDRDSSAFSVERNKLVQESVQTCKSLLAAARHQRESFVTTKSGKTYNSRIVVDNLLGFEQGGFTEGTSALTGMLDGYRTQVRHKIETDLDIQLAVDAWAETEGFPVHGERNPLRIRVIEPDPNDNDTLRMEFEHRSMRFWNVKTSPFTSDGAKFTSLGSLVSMDSDPRPRALVATELDSQARCFAKPKGWIEKFKKGNNRMWVPDPPAGYTPIGWLALGQGRRPDDAFAETIPCVREDLLYARRPSLGKCIKPLRSIEGGMGLSPTINQMWPHSVPFFAEVMWSPHDSSFPRWPSPYEIVWPF